MNLVGDSSFHARSYPPVPTDTSHSTPLLTLDETVDSWDQQNQARMLQMEQSSGDIAGLYEEFERMREVERKQMEARNRVDNHDKRRSLQDAIKFVGSCLEMCPVYERVRRTYQNNIKSFEMENGRVSPQRAVKAFSRPAAGQPPALPSDVRPPSVLVTTLDYLLREIVTQLPESHPFLWDRTRSIRQDFTYQNYAGKEAVHCTEIICRIHIICLHIMTGNPDWSQQQELEQMNKSLRTLDEHYNLYANRSLADFPHEPEIRAFQLLSRLFHPETVSKVEGLPAFVRDHPLVELALSIRSLIQSKNTDAGDQSRYADFFARVNNPETPVLFQILCSTHFPSIRVDAIRALRRSFHKKNIMTPLSRFCKFLGFESEQVASEYCQKVNIKVSNGWVDLEKWDEGARVAPSKSQFIESRLDFGLLSPGTIGNPSKLPQPIRHREFFAEVLPPGPTFATGNGLFGQPPLQPKCNANSTPAIRTEASTVPQKEPVQLPKTPSVPTPTPAPDPAAIKQFVNNELRGIAREILLAASKSASQKVILQRKMQRQKHDLFISQVLHGLTDDILYNAAHTTCIDAAKALELRRKSLTKLAVSRTRQQCRLAIEAVKAKQIQARSENDFIKALTDRRAPRLSTPIPAPPGLSMAPSTRKPLLRASSGDLLFEADLITKELIKVCSRGANILLVEADWQSEFGQLIKCLLCLDENYENTIDKLHVTNRSTERPDITLNFSNARLPNYISPTPRESLAKRICAQIDAYEPRDLVSQVQEFSVDDSVNVSVFYPLKRTVSYLNPPLMEVSSAKRRNNRAMEEVSKLQKLIAETKSLFE